ncbi:hypothetical protein [Syntrophomonas palmitatica]|uniref:hypothetical protein n=1 Tax=Syntrophomonas palmitatica TaxID=402877 RepID=UPI003F7000AF
MLLMARRANGGMRDALSTLDQVHSFKGHIITKEDVLDVLGLVDELFLARLFDYILEQDIRTVIEMLNTALSQGKEAQHLLRESVLYLRDLLLFSVMGEEAQLSVVQKEAKPNLTRQKGQVNPEQIMTALKMLMETSEKMRYSENNRFILEMAFIELTNLWSEKEAALVKPAPKIPSASASKPTRAKTAPKEAVDPVWNQILAAVKEKKIPTYALLVQGRLLGISDDSMYIGYKKGYSFHKEKMEEKGNRGILESVVQEIYKKPMNIELVLLDDEQVNDIVVKKAIELFGEEIVKIKN